MLARRKFTSLFLLCFRLKTFVATLICTTFSGFVGVVVLDGDLKLGLRTSTLDTWVVFDDFRLEYQGETLESYAAEVARLLEKADGMQDFHAPVLVKARLDEALAAAAALAPASGMDAYKTGISALREALDLTEAANNLYPAYGDMRAVFDTVIKYVPVRDDNPDGPLQLQICSLDYSSYVGKIGVGRVHRGRIRPNMEVAIMNGPDDTPRRVKVNQILKFQGLDRQLVDEAEAGDIILVNGIEELAIGTTITDLQQPEALPMLKVDEPTLTMNFQVNSSPLAGREGKFVTSRQIRERLERELKSNVAMRVRPTADETVWEVAGRGELHLTILLENMRREGYELAVSRPRVLLKEVDGVKLEPYELLTHGRRRRRTPGRRHGRTRPPQGRSAGHAARRQGARASRIPHSGPRPHRLPEPLHDDVPRHGHHEPRL